jgi:diguanylate cyclase (GGDEF)-like protein
MATQQLAPRPYLGRVRHTYGWRLVFICGLLIATLLPFWRTSLSQGLAEAVVGLTSTVVILVTAIRSKTHRQAAWYWLSASAFSFFLGDLIWFIYDDIFHMKLSSPSMADFFFISGYPLFFLGMRRIFGEHERKKSYGDVIDAGIFSLGALAVLWPTLIGPYLGPSGIDSLGVLTNILYPLMDLAMLFFVIRSLIAGRSLNPTKKFLLNALLVMFFSDLILDWSTLNGNVFLFHLALGGYIMQSTLMTVAALRSVAQSTDETDRLEQVQVQWVRNPSYRVPVVLACGLIPAIVYLVSVVNGRQVDGVALSIISSGLFLLVGARVYLLAARLRHQALHDHLTSLDNRASLAEQLSIAQKRIGRSGESCAILLIDLDDFKTLNDTLGHAMGDKMLCTVAERLKFKLRGLDTIFRIGGDEFVCLATGLKSRDEAKLIVERLLTAFSEPFDLEGASVDQRACIGWFCWDSPETSPSDALEMADLALYETKRSALSRSQEFSPKFKLAAVDRFALLQDLGRALSNHELSMHFQPIVNLEKDSVVGFESLMRWQHPTRGWVAPSEFIPAAEQSEMIYELGDFALVEAIAAASSWPTAGPNGSAPFVTVNLSARQFQDGQLITKVARAIAHHDLFASRLVLEITEGIAMENQNQTRETIDQLTQLGVSVALDDFGSGYSSLSTLIDFNPSILKIDQSFIRPAVESIENEILLESIISLGQRLNMIVLGEGIETTSRNEMLKSHGCALGQGYLWSPAMPAEEVRKYLANFPQHLANDILRTNSGF